MLNVGRIEIQKNQQFLIDILKEMLNINDNAYLIIVGNGSLKEQLLAKAKKLGVYDHFIYLGERGDIHDILKSSDVFVMTSIYEGLPTVAVEAQAAQKKVVLSDTISPETKLTESVQFLSLKESPQKWAVSILGMRSVSGQNEKLTLFDSKVTAEKMRKIYRSSI